MYKQCQQTLPVIINYTPACETKTIEVLYFTTSSSTVEDIDKWSPDCAEKLVATESSQEKKEYYFYELNWYLRNKRAHWKPELIIFVISNKPKRN